MIMLKSGQQQKTIVYGYMTLQRVSAYSGHLQRGE